MQISCTCCLNHVLLVTKLKVTVGRRIGGMTSSLYVGEFN